MIAAYTAMWARWSDFSGRSSVGDYWWAFLGNVIVLFPLLLLASVGGKTLGMIALIAYVVYALALFVPSLALSVRRLHDSDKTGWFVLVGFIPFVGGIALIVLMVLAGTPGSNRYGAPQSAS